MGLSQRRADAVKAYFVSNGFASNQAFTAIGHGKADQIGSL
jgi:outer membrane protein OmpA-like peptidoglycan-associated protein